MRVKTSNRLGVYGIKHHTARMGFDGSRPAFDFIIAWWDIKRFWNFFDAPDGESLSCQHQKNDTAQKTDDHTFEVNFFHEMI